MPRASSYNIHVPARQEGHTLIANGYTGALDLLPRHVSEVLMDAEQVGWEADAHWFDPATLSFLRQRGYVTELSPAGEREAVARLAGELREETDCWFPHFYILPTYRCQLHCSYCFQSKVRIRQRGNLPTPPIMSEAVMRAAFRTIDCLVGNRRRRSIGIYGGEPLQGAHREAIEKLVALGSAEGHRFLAATNAVDLDQFLDLLGPGKIVALHVPLDGPPAIHDRRRRGPLGPTFEGIVRNLESALIRNTKLRLRINIMRDTMEGLDELMERLEGAGFLGSPLVTCYLKAVYPSRKLAAAEFQRQGYVTEAEVAGLLGRYAGKLRRLSGYPIVDGRIRALARGDIRLALAPRHCWSVYVFDPAGLIYPCNNVAGDESRSTGRYYPELVWNRQASAMWAGRSVENLPQCLACKYALLCGGGCGYQALVANGELASPHCDDFGRTFERLLPLYYAGSPGDAKVRC